MSPKDSRNSPNHPQKSEGGNENKQRKNPIVFISLITGLIIATAIGASVITAVILKQGNLIGGNNTASPTPTVAETPTASPTPTVAETPTASPTPIVAETPTASPTPIVTESPTASPSSPSAILLKQNCQTATPGISLYSDSFSLGILTKTSGISITLGREVLPLLAYMSTDSNGDAIIRASKPAEFVCNLQSSFKELKLVFGVHSGNGAARPENKLLLEVFLDGKPAGTREVVVGSKQEWTLNIQGVKNVSLRAECTIDKFCPALSFTEMSLR
jgi:hypothetical protein